MTTNILTDTIAKRLTENLGGNAISFSYPSGRSAADYISASGHTLNSPQISPLSFDRGEILIEFLSASIVVTKVTGPIISAGTTVFLQIRRAATALSDQSDFDLTMSPARMFEIYLGKPAAPNALSVVASQACSATTGLANGINGTLATSGVATMDVPRGIIASWTGTAVLTISGVDAFGTEISEVSASGTSMFGKKAFKEVRGVSTSANITALTVGTSSILGLPMLLERASDVLTQIEGASVAMPGTITPGYVTQPSGTTGDIRGTYIPASTPDGVKSFTLFAAVKSAGWIKRSEPAMDTSVVAPTPVTVPEQVTGLQANRGDSRNDLSWTAPYDDGGSAITGYLIEVSLDGIAWATVTTTVGSGVTYSHTSLTNGTSYIYRVSAQNIQGTGIPSLTATGVPATYPGQVTALGVTRGDAQNVLVWTAPASDGGSAITDYLIEISIGGGAWAIVTDGVSASTGYTHTGLTNGLSYTYRVSAVTAVGPGLASTVASGTPATTPGQALSLAVSAGDASNSLTWAPPASNGGSAVTGYLIEVNIAAGGWNSLITLGAVLAHSHTSLTNGTNYVYRVTAINAVGTSATPSATANGTPAAAGAGAITLTELPRDRFIFDSGLGRGLNSATINLSGTGTDGVVVQARAVQATPSVYGLGYRDIPTFAGCLTPPTLVVGVDTLPAGVNYNAGTETLSSTVDLPGASPVMTGWSATNVQVATGVGKAPILFEDCEFTFDASSTVSGLWTLTSIPSGAYTPGLKNCTVTCPAQVDLTFVKCLRPQNGAIMGAPITGCYFVGLPSDFAYLPSPPAGETMRFADNIIEYTTNYPVGTTTYSAGTTYNTGDYMKYTDGFYYKARVDGLIGVGPTVTNGTDANWTQSDVHVDVWYLSGGGAGTVLIENNLTIWPNDVRLGRPNNLMFRYKESEMAGIDFGQYVIRNNQLNQHSGVSSFCAQVIANGGGGTRYGNIYCYGNRIVKGSGSQVFYPTGWPAWCYFSDNRSVNLATTYTVPASATAYTGTAPGDPVTWASAWTDIDTIASGVYAGSITVPRKRFWMTAEVRIKTDTGVTDTTTTTFGTGHVWAIYEQSNMARCLDPAFSGTTPQPVTDAEAVQFFSVNRIAHNARPPVFISDATPNSAATVAFANAFIASRPGEKMALAGHVLSGTSPMEMVSDGLLTRLWSDEELLHDAITGNGLTPVGLVTSAGWISWEASAYNLEVMFPVITQKDQAGTAFTLGDTVHWSLGGSNSFQLDHSMTEFYDWAYTRYALVGAHGRAMTADQTGYATTFDTNYEEYQTAWQAIPSNVSFTQFLPYSFESVDAARGVDDGAGGWTDEPHHSALNPDGLERHAAVYTLAILKSAGLVNWPKPNFTNAYWEPSGAYVDYWIAGHNITTERKRRGLAAIPATYPHRTEVMGWTINGVPATNAVIVANAGGSGFDGVRITPNSGVFTYASTVDYGRGRSVGFQKYPQDYQDSYWLNLAVVDMGQKGAITIPVKPLSTVGLANTLTAPLTFTNTITPGAWLKDTAASGSGITDLRIEVIGAIASISASRYIFALNNRPSLKVLNGNKLQMDYASTADLGQVSNITLTTGQTYTIVMTYDLTAKQAKLYVDSGAGLVLDVTHALANTASTFASSNFTFLATLTGTSILPGTWSSLKIWKNDITGAGTPYKTITGDAATLNAHTWKQGAGSFT